MALLDAQPQSDTYTPLAPCPPLPAHIRLFPQVHYTIREVYPQDSELVLLLHNKYKVRDPGSRGE